MAQIMKELTDIEPTRLILKNLPKSIDEKELRKHLKDFDITQLKLMYKPNGNFRRFAFVGVRNPAVAKEMIKELNNTYFKTSQMEVNYAAPVGSRNQTTLIPSNTPQTGNLKNDVKNNNNVKIKENNPVTLEKAKMIKKGGKIDLDILELDLEDKDLFEEFLTLHGVDPKLSRVKFVSNYEKDENSEINTNNGHDNSKNNKNSGNVGNNKIKKSACEKELVDKNNTNKSEPGLSNPTLDDENIEDAFKQAENTPSLVDLCRVFIRNLPYDVSENEIEAFFNKTAKVSQVYIVKDMKTSVSKGYAFVTFQTAADAIRALALDGMSFGGRVIHIIPAEAKQEVIAHDQNLSGKGLKGKTPSEKIDNAELSWNSLFLGTKTIAGVASRNLGISKEKLLKDDDGKNPMTSAVKLAIVETDIIHQTKKFLVENGVCLEAFNNKNVEKSKEVLVVKNLPVPTTADEIRDFITDKCAHFENFHLPKIIIPPSGVSALLVFSSPSAANRAFKSLYFAKFKYVPFLLEWAPKNSISIENSSIENPSLNLTNLNIIYIKNLNFNTTEENLRKKFENIGTINNVTIARDKDKKSLGFGFIEFGSDREAREAIKKMQHCLLDNHALLLKISTPNKKKLINQIKEEKNDSNTEEAIIIVKNLPFEANEMEIRQLFRVYGRLKNVRLPKKLHENKERHRGFCFVEFLSRQEAENAYETLRFSTHLYGRRLVLDWANRESDIEHMRKKAQCSTIELQAKKRKKHLNDDEDLD